MLSAALKQHRRALSNVATRPAGATEVFRTQGPGGRSSNSGHTATVFGATGFVGRYVVNNLGKIGTQVVTPYRGTDDEKRHLKLMGDLGQIVQLQLQLDSNPCRCSTKLARMATELGVNKFIHVSALGANVDSPSEFLRTKDKFWNRIGYYLKFGFVGLPIYNNGQTILRPVYVGDVAAAIAKSMTNDQVLERLLNSTGNPRSYKQQHLIDFFLDVTKRNPTVWYPNKFVAKRLADALNLVMPFVQISRDEIERAYIDEVASKDPSILTFKDFNIKPVTVEDTIVQQVRVYRPAEFAHAPYEKDIKRWIQ
ncbi:NAD(P)-binding protein [Rhizoclosmatium globosum]|uniref:NAD(P)-binding protein n=1 Tax=Rhizoclosmatium globosum TaxID=329046 RepID=A0A1Y2D1I4_9FUNG|nr:NAD(P)-binding protein [Rhizoclosmatium globosum]|eukprot:ORY53142.1 NAD(P)-binding protein [Rhizoclosmatium globosum]